jgi:hypothetical protein
MASEQIEQVLLVTQLFAVSLELLSPPQAVIVGGGSVTMVDQSPSKDEASEREARRQFLIRTIPREVHASTIGLGEKHGEV